MNNEFEQMVAELMGRVDKEIQILLPAVLPDGTPITAQNKENEVTYNYFINYIYKTGMGYDSDVPYTAYSAWARDTYGENRLEKFWSSLEELVLNPEGDMLDNLQNLLDVGGMVPVYGEPIDGVNAIIYFIRGDRVNGYLAAGSMIPFISGGVQGVKLVKKGAKAVDAADTVIDTTRAVDKVVDVGKGAGKLGGSSEVELLLDAMPELSGSNREKLLSVVQNKKLSSIVNELYRPGAVVGDGGTATKLMQEFHEGSTKHLNKAKHRLNELNKLANSGHLSLNDLDIVDALRMDLENAIKLFD